MAGHVHPLVRVLGKETFREVSTSALPSILGAAVIGIVVLGLEVFKAIPDYGGWVPLLAPVAGAIVGFVIASFLSE